MILFVTLLFGFSLVAVVGLFELKRWEGRTRRTVLPVLRARIDKRALRMKDLMLAAEADFAKLPPEALHFTRVGIHLFALEIARLARFLEGQAHWLADFVSHKHRFVRRAPRSEFLKKVTEHKNGNGNGVDTTADNVQN